MPPRRTRLKIPGMCAEDPPSYSELETNDRDRLRREAALAQVSQDATFYTLRFGWNDILRVRAEVEKLRDGDTDEDTVSDSL